MSMIGAGAELPARTHSLQMENRERLRLTGVSDVSGFDENLIALTTDMGELLVRGEGLHIDKIDLDAGLLELLDAGETLCAVLEGNLFAEHAWVEIRRPLWPLHLPGHGEVRAFPMKRK